MAYDRSVVWLSFSLVNMSLVWWPIDLVINLIQFNDSNQILCVLMVHRGLWLLWNDGLFQNWEELVEDFKNSVRLLPILINLALESLFSFNQEYMQFLVVFFQLLDLLFGIAKSTVVLLVIWRLMVVDWYGYFAKVALDLLLNLLRLAVWWSATAEVYNLCWNAVLMLMNRRLMLLEVKISFLNTLAKVNPCSIARVTSTWGAILSTTCCSWIDILIVLAWNSLLFYRCLLCSHRTCPCRVLIRSLMVLAEDLLLLGALNPQRRDAWDIYFLSNLLL